MEEQPKSLEDLYKGLHEYFLGMAAQGLTTHIIRVMPDPNKLLINLEVRPVAVPQPQAWAGGVSDNNGQARKLDNETSDENDDKDEEDEEDEEEIPPYSSGLANM